ncbi:unnamed protein product, partial [Amoebophrya sp. A25]|eukprot:GSA25T00005737001.1
MEDNAFGELQEIEKEYGLSHFDLVVDMASVDMEKKGRYFYGNYENW